MYNRGVIMVERMLGIVSRRADTRLSGPKLSVVIRSKERSHDAEVVNISSRGLRFKSETLHEIGEKLWFDLKSTDEKHPLSLSIKGKIVNDYVSSDDNQCSYGVKFNRFRYMNEIEQLHTYVYTIKKEFLPPQLKYGKLPTEH